MTTVAGPADLTGNQTQCKLNKITKGSMTQYPQPVYPEYASTSPDAADVSYLRTISILHYVWGGLILAMSCFAIVYIVLGTLMLNGTFNFPGPQPPPNQPTVTVTNNAGNAPAPPVVTTRPPPMNS